MRALKRDVFPQFGFPMTATRRQTSGDVWETGCGEPWDDTCLGGSGGLGGDEDSLGFGFSEGEVVVPDTDFEGVAERGESAHFAGGAFGEAEFEEALPDLGTEDESGDGG